MLIPGPRRVLQALCHNFAAIAGPLHALTRKEAVFHWGPECQDAFDRLKTLLTTSPITAFPDFSLPFRLYTDTSTAGLGAILVQVREGKERIICCVLCSLNQVEKAYPTMKLECLAIAWAVARFRPYLMSMSFEVYTDHYALQWLKTMHTGSTLLHRWLATLEEYDFIVKLRPGKSQSHVDGLSRLRVYPPPPEDAILQIRLLEDEDEARKITRELHTATHLGGHTLWKLFRDRYSHKAGRRICLETAQSCPQCQLGADYGHRQKTMGTIQPQGLWDTLSIDIVGPLPPDHRHEFLIVFVDCFSKYAILIPSSNHTATTVSEALMRHINPYFGTPRRLLSDRGREFISSIWTKLLRSLGVQQVLTSPYHPKGNAINERSHRTLNNMLLACLLEGPSTKAWVKKVSGIMLTLNAMPHDPHGFSASMIATGREPPLPPDLISDVSPAPAAEDPPGYVETIQQRLQLTHQQMVTPPTAPTANPYQVGSLIFALTIPPERPSKLAPRWKGPYHVCRIPNGYQVVYEDGELERSIHINHAKPAKFTAPDLPEPAPPVEGLHSPLGYLPAGFTHRPSKPHAPPVNHNEAAMPPPAAPTVPIAPPPAAAPANQHPEPAPPRRRSPRLNPEPGQAHAILSRPAVRQPHSLPKPRTANRSKMARTYPLTVGYNKSMRSKENPLSFASLRLVDLHNGQSQYFSTMKQLIDALPKTLDPAYRFVLRGHIARPGQPCLRHSMRAAMWFLLPSDGVFCRSSPSLQYYLTRQGRRVVLRRGDVTRPPLERRLNWVPDPAPTPPRDQGKENHPPPPEPCKLPRKMRPRRRKREHHQRLPGATGSAPGTSPPPRRRMSTPVKHPQLPQLLQHHQPPCSTANENSSRAHLPDQPDPGRLFKRAHSSISKESTTRSRRDNFSGSNLSFSSKQSHRDYISGSPCRAINKNQSLTDPQGEAISLSQSGSRQKTDPILTPPRAALPDVAIEVGPEPPEAASTSHIPREDRPPVILEIPCISPEPDKLSEPLQCPDRLVNGSSLHHKALRDRGPAHLPLHAVQESATLPTEDGVSNGHTTGINQMIKFLVPYPFYS